jgi:hypothetical protein
MGDKSGVYTTLSSPSGPQKIMDGGTETAIASTTEPQPGILLWQRHFANISPGKRLGNVGVMAG